MTLDSEKTVALLGILVICVVVLYRFVVWIMEAPRTIDPWDKEMDEAVNDRAAVPLCHHCLTPQEHNGWFCPECGATVGPYSNYLPYIYVFSQGEVLRAGVRERLRRSWLITVGYVLVSLGMFAFAAPVYWFFLFKNLHRNEALPPGPEPIGL
jgi:hypothetical protein